MTRATTFLTATALTLLPACRPRAADPPCEAPLRLGLVAAAGDRLNIGADGEAWPTRLRIYLLGEPPPAGIDLAALQDDDAALGAPVLARDDRVLYPDSAARWELARDPAATHALVAAFFRRPAGDGWYAVVPLPVPDRCVVDPPCVRITLDRNLIEGTPLIGGDDGVDGGRCSAWPLDAPRPAAAPTHTRALPTAPARPSVAPPAPSSAPPPAPPSASPALPR